MSADRYVRFPIRFDPWYAALSLMLFIPPAASFVAVGPDQVRVRMGWAFRATFPRSAVAGKTRPRTAPLSRGVHGWAGRWLVNGSGDGLLRIDLSPQQRGLVLGVPIRLQQLTMSLNDPDALARALS